MTRLSLLGLAAVVAGCGARSGLLVADTSDAGDGGAPANPSADAGGEDVQEVGPETGWDASGQSCPEQLPALASACASDRQVCAYAAGEQSPCDDVGQDDRVAYRCDDGLWLEVARCVDWSACPSTPPVEGTVCDESLIGLDCFYSTDGCERYGVVQCNGYSNWEYVNDCALRDVSTCLGLVPTLSESQQTAVSSGEQNLDYPSVAFAGTQMMVTYLASGWALPDHGIQGWRLQTAVPWQAQEHGADLADTIGRDAVTNPYVAFARDSFVLAWGANDGWPTSTSGQPGTFLRAIPLQGAGGEDTLVDPGGSAPTALSLRNDGGMLAYRYAVAPDFTKYAASVVALDPAGHFIPDSATTVADETLEEWFAPPVPSAFARIARWEDGYVVAVPAPASGDLWDDSGFVVDFFATSKAAFEPDAQVRVTSGLPSRLAVAGLADGTAVAAFVPESGSPSGIQLFKVGVDNNVTSLPALPDDEGALGAGPQLAAFDDGFAVAWSTTGGPGTNSVTLHLWVLTASGQLVAGWAYDETGMTGSDRIELDSVGIDRSLSLVWNVPSTGAIGSRVRRQRLVCRSGVLLD